MEYYENYDEFEGLPRIKNMPEVRQMQPWNPKPNIEKKSQKDELAALIEQSDEIRDYSFTYEASRHERQWILDSLGIFHDMQWFADILRIVKGGKEASVYQCLAGSDSPIEGKFIAAKVYRPRRFRILRNDHLYREGRAELDTSGIAIVKEKKRPR